MVFAPDNKIIFTFILNNNLIIITLLMIAWQFGRWHRILARSAQSAHLARIIRRCLIAALLLAAALLVIQLCWLATLCRLIAQ